MQRRRFKQTSSLDQRLAQQARRLREEAQSAPHGIEREKLVRRAQQAEAAVHIDDWLRSPGLKAPE